MAFDVDGAAAQLAALTVEVGRRWDWEADLADSIIPDQLAIMLNGEQVGYLDTRLFRIVEYTKRM